MRFYARPTLSARPVHTPIHPPTHTHAHTPSSTGVRCSRAQCRVNRVRVTTAAVVEVTPAVRSARFVHCTPGAAIVADRSPRPLASHPECTQVSPWPDDAFRPGSVVRRAGTPRYLPCTPSVLLPSPITYVYGGLIFRFAFACGPSVRASPSRDSNRLHTVDVGRREKEKKPSYICMDVCNYYVYHQSDGKKQ